MASSGERILAIYEKLQASFGPQEWWPGETPFEVMVGAVLTQNTNWSNVTRAIDALKRENVLSYQAMVSMDREALAELIRPAGYYNIKAGRLQNLLSMLRDRYAGDVATFLSQSIETMRESLLAVKGIGPETADSIVLYAAGLPSFVVDTYTYRIFSRHGLVPEETTYDEIQETFTQALPRDATLYNEYHALIVNLGKEFCRKTRPRCSECPLEGC